MKNLIILLLIAGIFHSCCCSNKTTQTPPPEQSTTTQQNSSIEQSEPKVQGEPQEVRVFDPPVMLGNLRPILGIGKSGIGGKNAGDSWEDPVGGMIGIETKILELSRYSSINSGINFSFQGAAYTETYSGYDEYDYPNGSVDEFSGEVTLVYVNIPFLYQYRGDCGIYGEIGIQPGLLLSAKDKFNGGSYEYKDYMKKIEIGMPIGVGYWVNNQLCIGVRAIWGLTNNSDSGSGHKDHNYLISGIISYNIGSLLNCNK